MAAKRKTQDIPEKILAGFLQDAPFDGWSDATLEQAAHKAGISDSVLRQTFPHGAQDTAVFFSTWADARMLEKMTPAKLKPLRIREKIACGVRTRLTLLAPHKEALAQALKFLGRGRGRFAMPKMVWRTADKIWWAAGDTATDHNHYTKRILLSGVITATTLYWLNDSSEDHGATWRFLDKRIDNVLKIGRAVSGLRKKA